MGLLVRIFLKFSFEILSNPCRIYRISICTFLTDQTTYFTPTHSIYEGVKNAWTWSRGLPAAGTILGLYESAAMAIVSKTTGGKDAATLDKEILHHITGLDKDVIDPAIAKLMAVIWPGVEKAEDILKCIPLALYLFPMLKEEGEAEPEATPVSKVTSLEVN